MDAKQFSLVVCSLSTVLKSQKIEKLHTGETNRHSNFSPNKAYGHCTSLNNYNEFQIKS